MLKHLRIPMLAVLVLALTAASCEEDPADPDDDDDDPAATIFTFVPPAGTIVTSVTVPGSFNTWNTTANPMVEQANGSWRASIVIPAGVIQYKFYINGEWPSDMCSDATWGNPADGGAIDADAEGCVDDNNGGFNATRTIVD